MQNQLINYSEEEIFKMISATILKEELGDIITAFRFLKILTFNNNTVKVLGDILNDHFELRESLIQLELNDANELDISYICFSVDLIQCPLSHKFTLEEFKSKVQLYRDTGDLDKIVSDEGGYYTSHEKQNYSKAIFIYGIKKPVAVYSDRVKVEDGTDYFKLFMDRYDSVNTFDKMLEKKDEIIDFYEKYVPNNCIWG